MSQSTRRITVFMCAVLGACSSSKSRDQPLMAAAEAVAGEPASVVQPTEATAQAAGPSRQAATGRPAMVTVAGSPSVASAGRVAAQAGSGGMIAASDTTGSAGMMVTSAAAGSGGSAGTSAMTTCQKGTTQASEVIFMGDSFITPSFGEIPQNIERLAREAGALDEDESYRMMAVPAAPIPSIAEQYDQAVRVSPVKVVIMDGAGIDVVVLGGCGTEAACEPVVQQVSDLWMHMGEQDVEWVVYLSYANLIGDDAANRRHDILRDGVTEVCNASTKPKCVLHDQRPTWDDHPEYYADSLHASAEGSRVTGTEIWKLMVQNCIAQ